MKYLFFFLCLIASSGIFAKQNVLLVFPKLENLSLTGRLTTEGIDISFQKFKELKDDINIIKIEPESNLKELAGEVERSIQQYKPIAIIGAITSNTAFVISDIAERYKIPFITPFATHPDVVKNKDFSYRACFDDSYQATQLASFAVKKLMKRRFSVLYNSSSSYSLGIKVRFSEMAKKLGAEVVSEVGVINSADLTNDKIKNLIDSKPQIVLIPSYQIEAASIIAKLAVLLPRTVIYLGPDSWGGGRLFHKVFQGGDINFEGYYVQHLSGVEFSSKPGFKNEITKRKLFEDTKQPYSAAMVAPVAIGHDTGLLLFNAIQLSKKNKILLVEAINKTSVRGLTGTIDFSEGHTPQKGLFIYKINKTNETFYQEYR
jgi:branched-chain amino acid transport system substrate-binding protein